MIAQAQIHARIDGLAFVGAAAQTSRHANALQIGLGTNFDHFGDDGLNIAHVQYVQIQNTGEEASLVGADLIGVSITREQTGRTAQHLVQGVAAGSAASLRARSVTAAASAGSAGAGLSGGGRLGGAFASGATTTAQQTAAHTTHSTQWTAARTAQNTT